MEFCYVYASGPFKKKSRSLHIRLLSMAKLLMHGRKIHNYCLMNSALVFCMKDSSNVANGKILQNIKAEICKAGLYLWRAFCHEPFLFSSLSPTPPTREETIETGKTKRHSSVKNNRMDG